MSDIPDLTPAQAWEVLAEDPDAALVDVRTQAEWLFVGLPDLDDVDREVIRIEWNTAGGIRNEAFLDELDDQLAERGIPRDAPVLFLCRSGARSMAAAVAAAEAGWSDTRNVAGGFEGDKDAQGHRGTVNGWKVAGLPWFQG